MEILPHAGTCDGRRWTGYGLIMMGPTRAVVTGAEGSGCRDILTCFTLTPLPPYELHVGHQEDVNEP